MSVAKFELEEMHFATGEVECPRCGSYVGERCINPLTNLPSKLPCLARVHALESGPAVHGAAA